MSRPVVSSPPARDPAASDYADAPDVRSARQGISLTGATSHTKDIGTLAGIMLERVRRSVATQDDDACRRLAQVFIEHETWQVPTLVSLRGKVYPRELTAAGDPRARYFAPPKDWAPGLLAVPHSFRACACRYSAKASASRSAIAATMVAV